jgi:hypothetical protein
MKNLRSFEISMAPLLLVAALVSTATAQEVDPLEVRSPPDVAPPPPVSSAPPAAMEYDPSIPLFANPRPGVFVPVILPPTARRSARATGMPSYAFVAELRFGGGGLIAGSNGNAGLQPSLFVGARLFGRLHLGLAFGLLRVSFGGENETNPSSDTFTTTIFEVEPTVSVDLVQARDRRVAFYLKTGVPLGALLQTDVARQPVVGYDIALGVRYLPHPMFGIGVEAGVTGLYVHPTHDDGSSVTMIYGALVGTFFAGK